MGGSQSKATHPICPPPPPCEKCLIFAESTKQCKPVLFNIIVPLIHSYIHEYSTHSLPEIQGCKLGTLTNVQLCNIVKFPVELPKLCSIDVHLLSLRGLDKIRINTFDYSFTPSGNLEIILQVNLGQLEGNITITPAADCGWLKEKTISFLTGCKNSPVILGNMLKPILLNAKIILPLQCDKPSDAEIKDLNIVINAISINCAGVVGYIPDFVTSKIISKLSESVSKTLQQLANDHLRAAVSFAITRGQSRNI